MPVASYLLGAAGWSVLDHKPQSSANLGQPPRLVPVGALHALDPQERTAICSGEAMEPHPSSITFEPGTAGTCPACNEQLDPSTRPIRS